MLAIYSSKQVRRFKKPLVTLRAAGREEHDSLAVTQTLIGGCQSCQTALGTFCQKQILPFVFEN